MWRHHGIIPFIANFLRSFTCSLVIKSQSSSKSMLSFLFYPSSCPGFSSYHTCTHNTSSRRRRHGWNRCRGCPEYVTSEWRLLLSSKSSGQSLLFERDSKSPRWRKSSKRDVNNSNSPDFICSSIHSTWLFMGSSIYGWLLEYLWLNSWMSTVHGPSPYSMHWCLYSNMCIVMLWHIKMSKIWCWWKTDIFVCMHMLINPPGTVMV